MWGVATILKTIVVAAVLTSASQAPAHAVTIITANSTADAVEATVTPAGEDHCLLFTSHREEVFS